LVANQSDASPSNWPVLNGVVVEEREPINHEQILRRLDWLASVLDDRYAVPGTKVRFGWASLVGRYGGCWAMSESTLQSVRCHLLAIYATLLGAPTGRISNY
jgi:hypothetical protein